MSVNPTRKWRINWNSRNFECPEYAAALYYLALTENQGKTTVEKTFVHLKRNFNALSFGLQQLILRTIEKCERSEDLKELETLN